MKAVTEFANFTINKALATKATLTAEGKTPEEIQAALGESFKLEAEKLTYFMHALDVASQNLQNLKRVLVLRLNEGEKAPAKAVQFEELYYVPEFLILTAPKPAEKSAGKFGGKGRSSGPKSSPWGMSPEELAMKNKKQTPAKPS